MSDCDRLKSVLLKLDNFSYKDYKNLRGVYKFAHFTLVIDHVQGDPFAAPSRVRVLIPQTEAKFPPQLYQTKSREIATRDYIARQFAQVAQNFSRNRGSGKSGLIEIASPGQEVLERTSVLIDERQVEIRFLVGLPARGRRIQGRQAAIMLCENMPRIVAAVMYESLNPELIQQHVETIEDADWLRKQLSKHELIAFVANGAILPRRSGIDPRPLLDVIPFQSPASLEIEFTCPNKGKISGMGITKGISLIVGGGYHGKSTLLKAIELGIYNHLPGDGREYVVTNPSGVKIRAEDGRSITGVDISPFINHLPRGRSTKRFNTTNASGSTSQSANIIEALEVGTELLLIDEDTSATNFMIRDRQMQALIAKEKEPITPFIDKVQQLYTDYGISTILVMGGSGDYFAVADRVIAMENYQPQDVTVRAKEISHQYPSQRIVEGGSNFGTVQARMILSRSINPQKGKREVSVTAKGLNTICVGTQEIDLTAIEQLVDSGQLQAIALALVYIKKQMPEAAITSELLDLLNQNISKFGLDALSNFVRGDLVQFRLQEFTAALNRLRSLKIQ